MRQRRQERFDNFGSDFVEEDDLGAQQTDNEQASAPPIEEEGHTPGPDSSFASIEEIESRWSTFESKLEVGYLSVLCFLLPL